MHTEPPGQIRPSPHSTIEGTAQLAIVASARPINANGITTGPSSISPIRV
ncbi:MAG: hypothetical protein H0T42_00900 [Deltaproteobacteria bacterium]|nr:hypothetical protein [Deltaproteobacteria bacterium]